MKSLEALTSFQPDSAATASQPIAIIGMSGRYPGGANSPELLWKNLKAGLDAVGEAQGDRWDLGWHHPDPDRAARVYTKAGGFLDRVDLFDAEFFGLSPREARQVDPQQRLLLELAWEAFEDAAIAPRRMAGGDTGVFVGISSNDYANLVGLGAPDAYSNTGSSFSIAANRISYILDLHGPSVAVDTACSSALVCVHQACNSIRAGECSTALAGAVSLLIHVKPWLGFAKASMLSPTGRCKSFDASGDGYVRSEGGGLVLLKPLADAERDGDPIYGVILASGVNSDGRTMGLSMPNLDAQEKLLRKVYSSCGVSPEQVVYVEAHGTGTAVGDPIECESIGRVLGAPRVDGTKCLIGSVKSNIGHLEAASGIAGLTKAILVLKHGEIPANLHFNQPNPKIDFENWKLGVVSESTPLPENGKPRIIGINSFGFGGTNAHVVMQEYPRPASKRQSQERSPWANVLLLSAQTPVALQSLAASYIELLRAPQASGFSEICASAALCRSHLRYRLAVAADSAGQAATRLESYLAGGLPARLATANPAAETVPCAFVYSGNGPQWWGMGRELLAENPRFRSEIEAVDAIFRPLAGWSLLEEMRRPEADSRMADTEFAQPMLFAIQVALTALLAEAGVVPSATLGHSVGEVAAAYAAGALDLSQATTVIYHRSLLQARTAGMGGMAALGIGAEEALEAIGEVEGWLELAACNAPKAVTVAGDPAALETLRETLTAAGKFARVLPLKYAFHTTAMDGIQEDLLSALQELRTQESRIPFISTVEGKEKSGLDLDAEYWWRNVREPVQFQAAVDALLDKGTGFFLEIGPHPVLRDYVQQCAKAKNSNAAAAGTLRRPAANRPEPEMDNLWTAICTCHANGAASLSALFERDAQSGSARHLPLYPWQRTSHWRGGVMLPDVHMAIKRDHPLLGYRIPANDGLWENTVDTNLLPYLRDHVVQGAAVFPAAGYIEMALSAGRLMLAPGGPDGNVEVAIEVEDFEILRPMVIAPQNDPFIQLAADSRDAVFEIRSRQDQHSSEWSVHTRGRLSRGDGSRGGDGSGVAMIDLDALRAQLPCSVDAESHYADAERRGLSYGPAFQGVRNVLLSAPDALHREALAEIHLPALDGAGLAAYASHPAILDSCIQVLITLIAQNERRNCSTIPVHVGRIRSFAPLPSRLFCHLRMLRESDRSAVADIRLTDADGKLIFAMEEARCQKVDFRHGGASTIIADWWRPDPARAQLFQTPLALSEPHLILSSITAMAAPDSEMQQGLDRLAGAYAAQALAALGAQEGPFDVSRLMRRGKVKSAHKPLLEKLFQMAEEDGYIAFSGGAWAWNSEKQSTAPGGIWQELFAAYPNLITELNLLARSGDSLAATLKGAPAPVAFNAEANNPAVDALFDGAPFQSSYNRLVRAALLAALEHWPAGRPVRILEIGGGGGGLAATLLPVLKPQQTDYLFTDISDAAIGRATHRFGSHGFARFAKLDIEQDPTAQGQPEGYFDIVVAGNTLHAVNELHAAFENIKKLLVPGGQLLAVEAHEQRFLNLVFGQDQAWWTEFEGSRLHSGSSWCELLEEAGFAAAVLGEEGAAQSVLLATSPQTAVKPARPDFAKRAWLLLGREEEFATAALQTLTDVLKVSGQDVHLRPLPVEGLSAADAEAIAAAGPVDVIVQLAGLAPRLNEPVLAYQDLRCLSTVRLVKALEAANLEKSPQLVLVTRDAIAGAMATGSIDPDQAPLWGLGRVISNEHRSLNCRLIDLSGSLTHHAPGAWLAEELLRLDDETEVQLAGGQRFVNRERASSLSDEVRFATAPQSKEGLPFQLDFTPQGGLDSLYLRAIERQAPSAGQVEIRVHAAGLNFRDVLWAMGMLPEEAVESGFSGPTIGMECSGEIVRVGPDVTGLKVGDRVIAFAASCFASHVTTMAHSVVRIPDHIDFESAATIPTVFLTAYYALDHLARLEAGEWVLIHGAAGGVGLAAIQIAKLKGAKVIGTAGSPAKRRMLEMLGVDHVLSSRSLEFAGEVMRLTGGRGVDVVLNSLAGEAITKGLQVLRPFGRFLEIGKRDLYANSRIGLRPFRRNISYFGIDADTLLVERAALAQRVFHQVIALFESRQLRPIPYQSIPVSRASEAFRAMQQSKHIGKLVVSMTADIPAHLTIVPTRVPVRSDATYLVTGGLGGFGLTTAKWLVEQGARSLALVGRKGAVSAEALAGVAALEAAGAVVRTFAADVASREDVERITAAIRAEMAPLRGVVHSAAVIEDAPVVNIEGQLLHRVLSPKMLGAWNLHEATLADSLDLFVLYSSSSVVIGNPGQGSYVAGNMYLDSLAQYRRYLGLPALAIGWGAIKDTGFLTRHANVAEMLKSRSGLDATPANEALVDLGRLSAVGATRVCVAKFNLQRLGQVLPGARVPRFLPIIPQGMVAASQTSETLAEVLKLTPEPERRPMVVARIREHVGRVLGTGAAQVDVDRPLAEMGLDSLMAVELAEAVEQDIGQPVSVMQMLSAGSVAAIAELVLRTMGVAAGGAAEAQPAKSKSSDATLVPAQR